MRIVILATEASGDFLGSELIKAIRIKKKNVGKYKYKRISLYKIVDNH